MRFPWQKNSSAEQTPAAQAVSQERMLAEQIVRRGIRERAVIEAMRRVPRHEFVPPRLRRFAYEDGPLPIPGGQTISQPYIVALMTELSGAAPGRRVLEIGTGSGYQAAVLAETGAEVFSIEIDPDLAAAAAAILMACGYGRVHLRVGDGHGGWPEAAPFDAILVTAAPKSAPPPLLGQLKEGGSLVIPVGEGEQELVVMTRTAGGFEKRGAGGVRFVPMTGLARS